MNKKFLLLFVRDRDFVKDTIQNVEMPHTLVRFAKYLEEKGIPTDVASISVKFDLKTRFRNTKAYTKQIISGKPSFLWLYKDNKIIGHKQYFSEYYDYKNEVGPGVLKLIEHDLGIDKYETIDFSEYFAIGLSIHTLYQFMDRSLRECVDAIHNSILHSTKTDKRSIPIIFGNVGTLNFEERATKIGNVDFVIKKWGEIPLNWLLQRIRDEKVSYPLNKESFKKLFGVDFQEKINTKKIPAGIYFFVQEDKGKGPIVTAMYIENGKLKSAQDIFAQIPQLQQLFMDKIRQVQTLVGHTVKTEEGKEADFEKKPLAERYRKLGKQEYLELCLNPSCFYDCNFCFYKSNIENEPIDIDQFIDLVVDSEASEVMIRDPCFLSNVQYKTVKTLLQKIVEKKLEGQILSYFSFNCLGRSDFFENISEDDLENRTKAAELFKMLLNLKQGAIFDSIRWRIEELHLAIEKLEKTSQKLLKQKGDGGAITEIDVKITKNQTEIKKLQELLKIKRELRSKYEKLVTDLKLDKLSDGSEDNAKKIVDAELKEIYSKYKDDIMFLLSVAGLSYVFIGFESGSNKVLKELNKRTTVENHLKSARLLTAFECFIYPSFILMTPKSRLEDIVDTFVFYLDYLKITDATYKKHDFPHVMVFGKAIRIDPGSKYEEMYGAQNLGKNIPPDDEFLAYVLEKSYGEDTPKTARFLLDCLENYDKIVTKHELKREYTNQEIKLQSERLHKVVKELQGYE